MMRIRYTFDSYADDLYRFAVSYVGSGHDAEDIVQEVFLKLLSKNMLFDRRFEKTYLLTMTANQCKDLLKSKARKSSVDLESNEYQLTCYDRFADDDRAVFDELIIMDEGKKEEIRNTLLKKKTVTHTWIKVVAAAAAMICAVMIIPFMRSKMTMDLLI